MAAVAPGFALDIITDALTEIGVYAQGEAVSNDDANAVLRKLNRLLDAWNADGQKVYAVQFNAFQLTPGKQPHVVGPGPASVDLALDVRPIGIKNANIIITGNNPAVRVPLRIIDSTDWAHTQVQGVPTTIPNTLWPEETWPNMNCWLWPVPSAANQLELQSNVLLGQFPDLNVTKFSLPPDYWDAITLTLAQSIQRMFGKTPDPSLASDARAARALLGMNNAKAPKIDATVPTGGASKASGFNYLSGSVVG